MAASKLARVFSGNLDEAYMRNINVGVERRYHVTYTTVTPTICGGATGSTLITDKRH
jgi:hypothetical protein